MGDEQFLSFNYLSLERRSRGDARSCACAGPGLGLVSTTISAGDRPNPTRQREIESNECALQHASAAGALPQCNISTSVQRELPFYSNIQGTSLRIRTPYYMEEGLRISLIYTHFILFLLNIWGTTYLHNMAGSKQATKQILRTPSPPTHPWRPKSCALHCCESDS